MRAPLITKDRIVLLESKKKIQALTELVDLLAALPDVEDRDELLQALVPRLEDDEITGLVAQLTVVLRNHLQENEYHELFLGDPDHHH